MNKKDRILELMKKGILSQEEGLDLLEGLEANRTKSDDAGVDQTINRDVDQLITTVSDKAKQLASFISKKVDENIEFKNGMPKIRKITKHVEEELTQPVDRMRFDGTSIDLKIEATNQSRAKLVIDYSVFGVHEDRATEFLAEYVQLGLDEGVLQLDITSKRVWAKVVLALPTKQYQDLVVKSVNGGVNLSELSIASIDLSNTNGNVELQAVKVEDATMKLTNGKMTVEDSRIQSLTLKSVNGNIALSGGFTRANLELVNGTIRLTQTDLEAQHLRARTVNGDIKVSVPEQLGLSGRIKSFHGGYKTRLRLDGPVDKSRVGVAIVRQGQQTMTIDAETKTGTIWLKDNDACQTAEQEPAQPDSRVSEALAESRAKDAEHYENLMGSYEQASTSDREEVSNNTSGSDWQDSQSLQD